MCESQFAILDQQVMATLRSQGYGADRVELWVVGVSSQESAIPGFAGTRTESCFASDAVYSAYWATKDDLWLIRPDGQGMLWGNLNEVPLDVPENVSALEEAIRAML